MDHDCIPDATDISAYLRVVGSYPLLTREQETDLGKRIEERDESARTTLIQSNLRLVVSLASKRVYNGLLPDAVQEGNIGLIQAAGIYNWRFGTRFSTIATPYILNPLRRFVKRERSPLVYIPEREITAFSRYQEALEMSTLRGDADPQRSVSLDLNLTPDQLERFQTYYGFLYPESLDVPIDEDYESLYGSIACSLVPIPDQVACTGRQDIIRSYVGLLEERQQEVIKLRFGLDDGIEWTLEDIGRRFNLSRQRIEQIQTDGLKRLRRLVTADRLSLGDIL
ncbi:sigma-70 family RNA polymerase sigma factor [Candidatus Woesearchaeota archaeon]|nr:sigma-70 family RNA polymerase sigma factor [Candidatus Woesearchaeota archaeon]HIH38257.1 sigma-70 family RNA polymerase sigma factor [Candidatus Woesearchaeota archaeon]HIH49169.1 sigma-70 family RNA polymerase sigma factor [Candidatus Woesearchaeota archaeon]HIJ04413.1 sigma-70 family RNA polymerase sigma factor [Candidatus Woesearchaeota archaeon]